MIYFDNAATTMPSQSVLSQVEKFNKELFFNPSALYSGGISCAKEIKCAKDIILKALSTNKHEVIFTASGSESDNMAIFCAVKRGIFVTDKGEHSAVYQSFLELKNRGLQIEFIDLNEDGTVDKEKLFEFVKNNKVDFVSIAHVGNETGAINDVNSIAKKLKTINKSLIFHVDGVQAFGKIPYKLSEDVDLYSISAHKINALKGVGALIKSKKINLKPLIFGGGQENGYRSGTENVFGIKVFEYAVKEKYENLTINYQNISDIKNYILENLDKDYFKIISKDNSSPYILTVSAVGIRGEVLMHALEEVGVIVGNGSACSSKHRYSRVLEACGYNREVLDGIIRISFSTQTTLDEAKKGTEIINETVKKLKGILS